MLYDALDAASSAIRKVVGTLFEMLVAGIVDGIRLTERK